MKDGFLPMLLSLDESAGSINSPRWEMCIPTNRPTSTATKSTPVTDSRITAERATAVTAITSP
jgi:hypothetical protein